MTIQTTHKDEIGTMMLVGQLDATTSPQLETALESEFALSGQLILNLAQLDYVSSAGLRVLMQGEKAARVKGKRLVLTQVPPVVMEVLEMTGFSSVLNIK